MIVFGVQILLVAILTCILATVGYYFFIDLANDVLFESLQSLSDGRVVLEFNFLCFEWNIALMDCALVLILAAVSLVAPMIKIRNIKPVKIIKARE